MPRQKREIIISEKKILSRLFKSREIAGIEHVDYKFIKRKKVAVYIPGGSLEQAAREMAKAGAGKIGEYENCSFRINGTGTFKPLPGSSPYSGSKNKINYADEVRLEMECGEDDLNRVLDAMLAAHPYEEPAYEVYTFGKRTFETNGIIAVLRKGITASSLIERINSKIESVNMVRGKITRLGITEGEAGTAVKEKFKRMKAGYLLSTKQKSYILNKL
jgi:hypothetical protein